MKSTTTQKLAKTIFYMTERGKMLLIERFIKKLRDQNKIEKSALLYEGIELFLRRK